MLRNRLYYFAKPLLPWRLRNRIRQALARRQRLRAKDSWPIDPKTNAAPADWSGWPDSKEFAVVLTHDVEGPDGLAKVLRLAEIERSLGFKSSYNLIPEGDYEVPASLRQSLEDIGFEVGIHDLHHDGHLLKSRKQFARNAARINHYIKTWNVSGFRAGFMLHNLEWFHDLEVAYDLSTFDTDPFEPQPDAAGTIFPYWVNNRASGQGGRPGYWEMPYTLPQDSTLFLVLRESTPDVWLRKLDWLVAQKGMVLVNVHPDYLQFPGERPAANTFPVDHYVALLRYLQERYSRRYWQPLPRELASEMEMRRGKGKAGARR